MQLTDPQFGMFADNRNFVQESANFEFAVAAVNRLHPAFVVVTGDLVNKPGDPAQIAEYKRILARVVPGIPVYNVAGNHDVGNIPTPASIAAYTNCFGPDHYTFRHGDFAGIVLDSSLIQAPQQAPDLYAAQARWLKSALEQARRDAAKTIVIFQHHPWFLKAADEADQYFNIPRQSRVEYLALFHEFGVNHAFGGHYHRNAVARDRDLEVVTTGPVGQPLGPDGSGVRIAIVRDDRIEHHYYPFGEMPNQIDLRAHSEQRKSH
ncbi:MAG: metallophosphoesterase [Limisphaerales bacterium]